MSVPRPLIMVFSYSTSVKVLAHICRLDFICPLLVFKIVRVTPIQFEVYMNFRDLPQKQLNLNYSSNDVKWNLKDGK